MSLAKSSSAVILSLLLCSFSAFAAHKKRSHTTTHKTVVAQPLQSSPTKEAASGCDTTLLMDAASGEILGQKNIHLSRPPASMVKMMVAYVVLQKIKDGAISLDTKVSVSATASKIGGSQVYLKEGEGFTVNELLQALLIQSANDAAYALAEHIAGTPAGFVEIMNVTAKKLGMNESTFHSPHGLPPGRGQEPDLASAYDMSILGRAMITNFPQALQFTSIGEQPFRDGTFIMRNHNKLVNSFPGCDGIKTGYYTQAGFCLTATAKRNGVRLIAVLMGCAKSKERDALAAQMLGTGFASYNSVKVVEKSAAVERSIAVNGGAKNQILPLTADSLTLLLRDGDEKKLSRELQMPKDLTAPLTKGANCGALVLKLNGQEVGRVGLISPEDVPKAGVGQRFMGIFGG